MLNKRLSRSIGTKISIGLAITLAVLNLVWLGIEYSSLYHAMNAAVAQGGSAPLLDQSVTRRDLMIELALIATAIGVISRNIVGKLVSLFALTWIGIEYIWWCIRTKRVIEAAGLSEVPSGITHAWNFAGATPWNLVVLVVTFILFLWELRVAREIFKANNGR